MRPELLLVSAYALVVVVGALGLDRMGRSARSAWNSRVLAANRRAAQGDGDEWPDGSEADWPHTEVPRLHTAMALVAAGAGTAVPLAALLVLPRKADALVLSTVVVVGLAVLARLARSWNRR